MTSPGLTLVRAARKTVLPGLALALSTLLACGPEPAGGGGDDEDTEGEPTGTTASTPMTTATMTAADDTVGGGEADAGSDDNGTTSGDMEGSSDDGRGFIDDAEGSGDGGAPQPLGGMCSSGAECDSGFCYDIPMFGGVCSECLMDSDCETGTCAGDFNAGYAVCTDGSLGLMCDSDEGCMGDLVCGTVIDTGGIFPLDFCSECNAATPCDGMQICTPVYDLANFQGSLQCAEPGSVEDGGGCPLGDDTVCASGFCGAASIMGFLEIGVCGECNSDMDCPMPDQTCVAPTAGQGGVTPAVCQ